MKQDSVIISDCPSFLEEALLLHLAFSLALLTASLAVGMWAYRYLKHLPWRDTFLNDVSMLLGGMGPVRLDLSESWKVFAGSLVPYSGLVVIAVTPLLAPGIHHIMKRVCREDTPDAK